MNEKELILLQTADVYQWTNRLIEDVPFEQWEKIPEVLDTSIYWQLGHLIMSHYFHTVMVITGHQKDVFSHIQMKEYSQFFTMGKAQDTVGLVNAETLLEQLKYMQNFSLKIIESLDINQWNNPLEPTQIPHPIAKTKLESLDWNIKHTMYHNGQLGILRRVLNKRYDFGLKTQ